MGGRQTNKEDPIKARIACGESLIERVIFLCHGVNRVSPAHFAIFDIVCGLEQQRNDRSFIQFDSKTNA